MKNALLMAGALLLLLPGCAVRGGSGGGGDDDDDDGGGGGSSTAWVRTSYAGESGTEYDHDLWITDGASACASIREMQQVSDALYATYSADYDAIEEEFGGTEGPGAQEALCESDQRYYSGLLDADLPLYAQGAQSTTFSISGVEDPSQLQIPPGAYVDWDGEADRWFDGWRSRVDSLDWLEGWSSLDCSDLDAYDDYNDIDDIGVSSSDIGGGTLWLSNPSSSQTDAIGEDLVLTDEDGNESNFTLDASFPLCEISGD